MDDDVDEPPRGVVGGEGEQCRDQTLHNLFIQLLIVNQHCDDDGNDDGEDGLLALPFGCLDFQEWSRMKRLS